MPEASKNIAIGSLVALALGLLLWALLFLHPSFGDGKFQVHVRFDDIEKVNVGTRITYAGRPVGQVTRIQQVPEEERTASDRPDDLYIYDLTLAIDSSIPLFDSDEITIGTSGLMGERFISIVPRRPTTRTANPIAYDEVIYSKKAPSLEDAFHQLNSVAVKAEETMEVLATLVKENREDVNATVDALQGASKELNTMLARANELKLVDAIAGTMNQANTLLANVSKGDGTLGKLLTSDDFYLRTQGLLTKLDVMMNDVNHYGVLYHLDKSWQREQRGRLEELAKLSTPRQFRSYLNEEMYKITTAVTRLGSALDKAQAAAGEDTPIVANADFARTFNEVLSQIQDLQATLKTYSIDLSDKQTIAQEK